MRDCFCTINLDQEEVYRTQVVEKSLRLVEKLEIIRMIYIHSFMYFPDFYHQVDLLDLKLIFLFKGFLFYSEFIFLDLQSVSV